MGAGARRRRPFETLGKPPAHPQGPCLGGRLCAALLGVLALLLFGAPARAQIGSDRYSSIVIDARTGEVLEAVNPDEPRYPASLTKMMTLYMLFEALRDRRISLDDMVPVSAHAASMEPEKLGLVPGMPITVEQAVLALVTLSANDAAAALGELLAGDEDRFAQMMTLRARALGMSRTTFRNASGLPDLDQVSTARDLALLARHLILDFPTEYRYFSTPSFVFRRRVILNHDRMLQTYPGADGIKTGFIRASGHNIATSAVRGDVRLVGVVLGAASNPERDIHMAALLDDGFEREDVPIVPHREMPLTARLPGLVAAAQAATLPVPATAHGRIAEMPRGRVPGAAGRWAVQVGSFGNPAAASRAAVIARHGAGGGEPRLEPNRLHGKPAWRAQLSGLTQQEAQAACASIARTGAACFVVRTEQGQIASR
ncbi:MAG: D-alanyl-D-alanine carboxypeptidase [Acidisphaera sp.]|nr:D-alanyl-D-alanine carboxypeptidase [Acidisphaera sp.]